MTAILSPHAIVALHDQATDPVMYLDWTNTPQIGDWIVWKPLWFGMEVRQGECTGIESDEFGGYVFYATMADGLEVWGHLGNILSINGVGVDRG